jgi:hypothetical protein
MNRFGKLAITAAVVWMVLVLPAFAGSLTSFSNVQLQGVSATTLSGSFVFGDFTGVFSKAPHSLGGNSMFEGAKVNNTPADGYYISEGSFSGDSDGGFSDEDQHRCRTRKKCEPVPEGGTQATYLMLSVVAVFCGILVSGKRRNTRSAQSI